MGNHIFKRLVLSSMGFIYANMLPVAGELGGDNGRERPTHLNTTWASTVSTSAEYQQGPVHQTPSPETLTPRREKFGPGKGFLALHKDLPEGSS